MYGSQFLFGLLLCPCKIYIFNLLFWALRRRKKNLPFPIRGALHKEICIISTNRRNGCTQKCHVFTPNVEHLRSHTHLENACVIYYTGETQYLSIFTNPQAKMSKPQWVSCLVIGITMNSVCEHEGRVYNNIKKYCTST